MTSVVITYDHRPFMDWYRNYASRRDETRGIIAVDMDYHYGWFRSIKRPNNVEIMKVLSECYERPVEYALKNFGHTIKRIMGCEERRRGHEIVVVHKGREEKSDDDTSSEESDDGEPATVVPLPLR